MESYIVKPKGPINCDVHLPGSKSYSNRALLIAGLAEGQSVLKHLLESDDTKVMKKALRSLGVENNDLNDQTIVKGTGGIFKNPNTELYLQNAGTATRFLTTACSLVPGQVVVNGNERMQQRPIQDLLDGLIQLGVNCSSPTGCPPITIQGPSLKGGVTTISGKISSQYISSILISAPYALNPVTILIKDELVSKPYVDVTLDIMKTFGIEVKNFNYERFEIPLGRYKGCDYTIEPDASGASYFLNAAALTKGTVKVHINSNTVQGDFKYYKALERMGCKVKITADYIELTGGDLVGIDIDMEDIPDMVQSLVIVAAFAKGVTRITNIYNLRVKETDRIDACYNELKNLGIEVSQTRDSITVFGGKPHAGKVKTYDDHRMAMAFSGIGLVIPGVEILDPGCVSKTFPEYWKLFEELH